MPWFRKPDAPDLRFDDEFARASIANYAASRHAETIRFVPDPLVPGGRTVVRCEVPDTAVGPTPNPRMQMSTPSVLLPGTEVWAGFGVMFPSGSGPTAGAVPFPSMPEGHSGFMNVTQFYTSRPKQSPSVKLGFRASAGRELMWQRNDTYGQDRPWRLGHDVVLDVVYEFVHHVVLSDDPEEGLVELWMRTSPGEGWRRQTFFAGRRGETQTLRMRTLDANENPRDPSRHDLQLYRKAGMFDTVTLFFYGHRVGRCFAEADTGYHSSPVAEPAPEGSDHEAT